MKMKRRLARAIAVQTLYEVDLTGHNPGETFRYRLEDADNFSASDVEFARTLVFGVLEHQPALDELVHEIAPEWPVEQMAVIDRTVLRMAIYELQHMPDTPIKVVINEAVELAKMFGGDSSRRLVNGALGTFVNTYLDRDLE